MDITHDNVCSSMLSCFYSHLLSTGRPISSFKVTSDLLNSENLNVAIAQLWNELQVCNFTMLHLT